MFAKWVLCMQKICKFMIIMAMRSRFLSFGQFCLAYDFDDDTIDWQQQVLQVHYTKHIHSSIRFITTWPKERRKKNKQKRRDKIIVTKFDGKNNFFRWKIWFFSYKFLFSFVFLFWWWLWTFTLDYWPSSVFLYWIHRHHTEYVNVMKTPFFFMEICNSS